MGERIYIRSDNGLEPMEEQPFDVEDTLQALIAEHPELLDGEQIRPGDPRRWILVTREKGIAATPGGADWWSLDHLYIDQDAMPTLVEVKRGANPEIRRKVVGQMLDYAAHAPRSWTADELRETFEANPDHSILLRNLLKDQDDEDEPDTDAFWKDVATNLAAKNLRLLFVADAIPDELVRVVEFLNRHMNIEVLAVELKQFKSKSSQTQTLVPACDRKDGRRSRQEPRRARPHQSNARGIHVPTAERCGAERNEPPTECCQQARGKALLWGQGILHPHAVA